MRKASKNRADIFRDHATNDVVVIGKGGKEVFRRPYSRQVTNIAHAIYFAEKYGDCPFHSEQFPNH